MSIAPSLIIISLGLAAAGFAQPVPDYDFRWSVVGAPGNAPYVDNDPDYAHQVVNGRGSVGYEYRMSSLETTTGQWMEFLNAFGGPQGSPNAYWQARPTGWWNADPVSPERYELRADVPDAAMTPVFGVSWRMAAMYCNWLQGGKSPSPDSLLTGAYDVSTWGFAADGRSLTDAPSHLPGASFWIPTLDEQLKSFQYDPNRYGSGQGGWWLARNKSDMLGVGGLPGAGSTSAGYSDPNDPGAPFNIPLGAYPLSLSPWGLWDSSGGTSEWNEEFFPGVTQMGTFHYERGLMGSSAGGPAPVQLDMAWGIASGIVQQASPDNGLRIASLVPAPGVAQFLAAGMLIPPFRQRRRRLR